MSTLASTAFDDVLAPLAENAVDASSYHSYHPAPLNQAPESANGFLDWSAALNGLEKGRQIKGKYSGQQRLPGLDELSKYPKNEEKMRGLYCLALKNEEEIRRMWGELRNIYPEADKLLVHLRSTCLIDISTCFS